jgi:hypothetical protein
LFVEKYYLYKTNDDTTFKFNLFKEIFEVYISEGSKLELNVPYKTKNNFEITYKLNNNIESLNIVNIDDSIDLVLQDVMVNLTDTWQRFKDTRLFLQMIKKLSFKYNIDKTIKEKKLISF